jgi:hypothetical protein
VLTKTGATRDHHRHPDGGGLEQRVDREQRGLGVERVEDGLHQQEIGAAVEQAACPLGVGGHQLVERDVAEARVVDVGRERRAAVGRAEHARHEAGQIGVAGLGLVRGVAGKTGGGVVELVDQVRHAVVGERHRVRGERVGLDDVGARLEVRGVDGLDDPRLGQRQEVAVAPQVAGPVGEPLAAVVPLGQAVGLDHRPHGAVEHQDALREERLEQGESGLPGVHPGGGSGWSGLIKRHRLSGDKKAPEGQNASGGAF